MAFLFKSKKHADKAHSAKDGSNPVAGSQSSLQSASARGNEKGGPVQPSTTPQSSVNNSMNSLQGGAITPSPEQVNPRRGPVLETTSDLPLRNMAAPPVSMNNPSLAPNSNASLYPWSQRRLTYTTSHPPPFPRYGAAVNSVSSKEGDIYLMGGLINSATVKGDLWMVEAGGNMACYPLATTAEGPGPRVGHASLLVGNAFIVYGGDTKMEDSDILDETLYLLNTSTRQWSRAVPAGPRPAGRYGHSLNIVNSKIYVFGGQVEGYFMNDLVAFDLNQLQNPTNRWEMLIKNSEEGGPPAGEIPPARTNHSVVTFDNKLYLFGGTNGFQWFNDVWCYDPVSNAWTALDCIGYIPAPREGHAAAIVEDVMYIFGGRTEEGADLGDLAAFRISSRRWYTFQNMGPSPSPRSGHSMTAYGKQIVILAGEPSTATREASDLSIVYQLDTSKIRYPVDNSPQTGPTPDRIQGQRRPSASEKPGVAASRGLASRDGSVGPTEQKRANGPPPRESVVGQSSYGRGQPGPGGNEINGGPPTSSPPQPPGSQIGGSKLPRASMAQAPPGPPPSQQAPNPRQNGPTGALPAINGRGKVQGKPEKGFGPPVDTAVAALRNEAAEASMAPGQTRGISPGPNQSPQPRESPVMNGRKTPTQSQNTTTRGPNENGPPVSLNGGSTRSRQGRGHGSIDSTESSLRNVTNRDRSPPPPTRQGSNPLSRKGSARNSQTVALLQELDAAKNRNAWYASELELARKAGYMPNPSTSPVLDQRAAESFDDDDKPLIEALIAMKSELANVQSSIDKQAVVAAKKIAEVEKQRDVAVSEAVYAKARLAAQGGSQASTPQPDSEGRDIGTVSSDRSTDISRKLAAALAEQRDLKNRLEILNSELESERRVRQLAEDTSTAHQSRMAQLESYKQQNASEVERLKAELHDFQTKAREDGIVLAGAVAAVALVRAEKESLEKKYNEVKGSTRDHSETFESLREAVASSADMRNLLERKLEEERLEREKLQNKLIKLKSEHENSTTELETAMRRLRDAEELAEQHAQEAKTHRQAVLSGLDKVSARDVNTRDSIGTEKHLALQNQIQAANALVRKYQSAADSASEKLRSAEERIAGLEAYQEQASREGMSIRKQLQSTMRDIQTLQAKNSDMKHQLANQQLETNAVHVQHNTLKDILGERGMSPVSAIRSRGLSSPQSGSNTPDPARLRELEQQLAVSTQTNSEMRSHFEAREQETEGAYREKLSQLENDYQSAVHYVKGTEKMLKRMKDELTKHKTENTRMKSQLDEINTASKSPGNWEEERTNLTKQIDTLQAEIKTSSAQLERQIAEVKEELSKAQTERDNLVKTSEQTLAQLQQENAQLERRAQDAEQKVSLLLDQVESSVDNYRRQSRNPDPSSHPQHPNIHSHQRNLSAADSVSSSSIYGVGENRNSMALDSLASELETLRSHWETTNKNYRLSKEFEFEDRGGKGDAIEGLGLSGNLTDWRKRLDEEEEQVRRGKGGVTEAGANTLGVPGGLASPTKREMSPSGKEVAASGVDKNQVNII